MLSLTLYLFCYEFLSDRRSAALVEEGLYKSVKFNIIYLCGFYFFLRKKLKFNKKTESSFIENLKINF